jgi:hypothetical protein
VGSSERARALYERAALSPLGGASQASVSLKGPAEMDLSGLQGQARGLEQIGTMVGVTHRSVSDQCSPPVGAVGHQYPASAH